MEIITKYYRQIKNTYRHYSSFSGMNQTMCIGANTLKDILNHMGAIDFKYLTLAIVSVEMTTVDTASFKYKNNPEHNLVRHEFIEFLVRAADTKLFRSG